MPNNIIANYLSQLVNMVIPIIVLPIISEKVGTEYFGIFTIILSYCAIYIMVIEYGSNVGLIRVVANSKLDQKNLIVENGIASKIILISIIFTINLIWTLIFYPQYIFEFQFGFLYAAMIGLTPYWYFIGIKKNEKIAIANVSSKIILVIILWSMKDQVNSTVLIIIYFISPFSSLLFSFLLIEKKIKFEKIELREALQILKRDSNLMISNIMTSGYQSIPVVLVGTFIDVKLAGSYFMIERMASIAKSIFLPLNNTIFPYLCIKKNNDKQYYVGVLLLCLIVTIVYMIYIYLGNLYCNQILDILGIKSDSNIKNVYKYFLIVPLITSLSAILSLQVIMKNNSDQYLRNSYVLSSLVGSGLILYGVSNLDISKVAFSVVITECLVLIIFIIYTMRIYINEK